MGDSAIREKLEDMMNRLVVETGTRDFPEAFEAVKLCESFVDTENIDEAEAEKAIAEGAAMLLKLKEAAMVKTEDGVKFPAAAFAFVPDAQSPSTWKLRLWQTLEAKVTRKQLGAATAAFSPGGFRGNKVQIPASEVSRVKARIRSEFRKLGVPVEELKPWIREAVSRELIAEYVPLKIGEADVDKIAQGIVPVDVIVPGFNTSETRYYPESTMRNDFGIFEGAKMYADHPTRTEEKERPERSIRDWVSKLINVRCAANGVIKAEAKIHEPWFKEKVKNLFDAGQIGDIGLSINAFGEGVKTTINGVKTVLVERFIKARSVDWVTDAGAGGKVNLYESATNNDNDIDLMSLEALRDRRGDLVRLIEADTEKSMTEKFKVKETGIMGDKELITTLEADRDAQKAQIESVEKAKDELQAKLNEVEKSQAQAKAQESIKTLVAEAKLPDASKERLLEQFKEAETDEGMKNAIEAEVAYVGKLTEAGAIKNMGSSNTGDDDPEKVKTRLKESFKDIPGTSDKQAEIAANL